VSSARVFCEGDSAKAVMARIRSDFDTLSCSVTVRRFGSPTRTRMFHHGCRCDLKMARDCSAGRLREIEGSATTGIACGACAH
jgi:hypothetical protein